MKGKQSDSWRSCVYGTMFMCRGLCTSMQRWTWVHILELIEGMISSAATHSMGRLREDVRGKKARPSYRVVWESLLLKLSRTQSGIG